MKVSVLKRAVAVAVLLAALSPAAQAVEGGAWAERVQVLYDAGTRSVQRVLVKAWDAEPALNLEFLWEPEPATRFDPAATGGVIEGRGKLVWLVRGSAAHDRRAIYSTYVGDVRHGRPHGHGRLDRRDGEVFEGEWAAGRLHGEGMHLDARGNRYTGSFVDGLPHGEGRHAMADGSIYQGRFVDGLRDGEGRVRLAGGTEYASRWRAGVETGAARPDAAADAMVGGLLRAQAGGGDAGKVELSVIVEPRMNRRAPLGYTHAVEDQQIDIYPDNDRMVDVWTGEALVEPYGYYYTFGDVDWDNAPAFVQVSLDTVDGSRVRLDRLELQVEDSQVYRKPFLSVVGHEGCIGYRPSFSFQNNGWSEARDATLTFEFYNLEDPDLVSRSFELDAGGFDEGIDVSVASALDEMGVDTATLASSRFTCPSLEQAQQCRQQVLGSLNLGEAAPLISGRLDLSLGVRGRIAYRWADDRGNVFDQEEPMQARVHVGFIETQLMVAEGGDLWQVAPDALRYQEVRLPEDAQDYVVEMPVRGNRNLASHVARLKFFADHSSVHSFRAAARFADGSERYSKPVHLYYLKPRENYYVPAEPETACYLDPGYFSGDL